MTTAAPGPRVVGVLGLAAVALVFVPVIAVSTLGEPELDASTAEVSDFFAAADVGWYQPAEATFAVGMLVLVWYLVAVAAMLRRVEGEPGWRAGAGLCSGLLFIAYGVVDASWEAAAHRGDALDVGLAAYAFDVGNLGFANAWLSMAGLAGAWAWVLWDSRAVPRWQCWVGLVGAAGLVVARYAWESSLWFAPYFLFWVWFIALAVHLVRGRPLERRAGEAAVGITERTRT